MLEEGTYTILAGTNVRNAKEIGSFALTETVVLEELSQQLAPRRHLERMTPKTNEMVHLYLLFRLLLFTYSITVRIHVRNVLTILVIRAISLMT